MQGFHPHPPQRLWGELLAREVSDPRTASIDLAKMSERDAWRCNRETIEN
jgi:hypothetical protein